MQLVVSSCNPTASSPRSTPTVLERNFICSRVLTGYAREIRKIRDIGTKNTSFSKTVKNPVEVSRISISRMPERIWIAENLARAVRISSYRQQETISRVIRPFVSIDRYSSEYSPNPLIAPSADTLSEQILQILTHKFFRRVRFSIIAPYMPYFLSKITESIEIQEPITIVFPALPFKDQNPERVNHAPNEIDLGELVMFANLSNLIESINRVYPPGLRIIFLTDGIVYSDIFHINELDAVNYRENVKFLRDLFSLRASVEIVDMNDLVTRADGFQELRAFIRNQIHCLLELDPISTKIFSHLVSGMRKNLAPDHLVNSENAALDYASFLLALRFGDVISRFFPFALRATVHLKDSPELPLYLVSGSNTSPYNGVPLVDSIDSLYSGNFSVRIVPVSSLGSDITQVYLANDNYPFFYARTI